MRTERFNDNQMGGVPSEPEPTVVNSSPETSKNQQQGKVSILIAKFQAMIENLSQNQTSLRGRGSFVEKDFTLKDLGHEELSVIKSEPSSPKEVVIISLQEPQSATLVTEMEIGPAERLASEHGDDVQKNVPERRQPSVPRFAFQVPVEEDLSEPESEESTPRSIYEESIDHAELSEDDVEHVDSEQEESIERDEPEPNSPNEDRTKTS